MLGIGRLIPVFHSEKKKLTVYERLLLITRSLQSYTFLYNKEYVEDKTTNSVDTGFVIS